VVAAGVSGSARAAARRRKKNLGESDKKHHIESIRVFPDRAFSQSIYDPGFLPHPPAEGSGRTAESDGPAAGHRRED